MTAPFPTEIEPPRFFETTSKPASACCVKREFFIRKLAAIARNRHRPFSFATPAFAGCAPYVGRKSPIYCYQCARDRSIARRDPGAPNFFVEIRMKQSKEIVAILSLSRPVHARGYSLLLGCAYLKRPMPRIRFV